MTGVNMVHVPYRGSAPMVADLLRGHVQLAARRDGGLASPTSDQVRCVLMAVAGKTRFAGLPDAARR